MQGMFSILKAATLACCCISRLAVAATLPDDLAQTSRPDYQSAVMKQRIRDAMTPPHSAVILGDSIMFYIPDVKTTFSNVLNLAIVGDTTSGILARVPDYHSLKTASVVVIEGGVNDMFFDESHDATVVDNYRQLINSITSEASVAVLGAFPVDERVPKAQPGWNARISSIDDQVYALCRATPRCEVIDLRRQLADADGNLRADYHRTIDGIHPNAKAYSDVIIPALKGAIGSGR